MRRFFTDHRRSVLAVAAGLILLTSVTIALLLTGGSRQAIKPGPTATSSATATATSAATPSPVPTPTPLPSTSPASSPTSSARPTTTATAQPTPTPAPSRSLPASMRGVEWYALPTSRKIVALTFDAGSGDQGLATILKTLSDKGVPGTFFLTGQFIQSYANDAHAIAALDMHSIGNHTVDHPHLNQLTDAQVRDEILSAERSIVSVTTRDPWPLFRFPYGESSSRTVGIANSLGYGSIRWTVDTLGWEGTRALGGSPGGQTVESVTSRSLNAATAGEIILMHVGAAPDGTTLDAAALGGVIDGLRARGYGFVAIWDFIDA